MFHPVCPGILARIPDTFLIFLIRRSSGTIPNPILDSCWSGIPPAQIHRNPRSLRRHKCSFPHLRLPGPFSIHGDLLCLPEHEAR